MSLGMDVALSARMGERDLCTPQQMSTRLRDFNSEQNRQASGASKTFISPTTGRSVKRFARASSFGPFLSRSPKLTPRRPNPRRRRPISSPPPAPKFHSDTPRVRPFLRGTPQSCQAPRSIGLWSPSPSPISYRMPTTFKVFEDDMATPKQDTPLTSSLQRMVHSIEPRDDPVVSHCRLEPCALPQRAERATANVVSNNREKTEEHRAFDFTLPQATRPDTRPSALARIRYSPIGVIGAASIEDTIGSPAVADEKLRAKAFPFWSDLRMTPTCVASRPALPSNLDVDFISMESPVLSPVVVLSGLKEKSALSHAPTTIMPSSCLDVQGHSSLCDRCRVGIIKQYVDAEVNTSPGSPERAAAPPAALSPGVDNVSSTREIGIQSSPQQQEEENCSGGDGAHVNSPVKDDSEPSTSSSIILALPFGRARGASHRSPAVSTKSAASGKSALRRDIFSSPQDNEVGLVSRADRVRQHLFAHTSSALSSDSLKLFPDWPHRARSPEVRLSRKRDSTSSRQSRLDGLDSVAVGNAYPLPEPLRASSSQCSPSFREPGEPERSVNGQSRLDSLDATTVNNAYPLPEPLRAPSNALSASSVERASRSRRRSRLDRRDKATVNNAYPLPDPLRASSFSLPSETDEPGLDSSEAPPSGAPSPIIPLSLRDTVECFELKPEWLRRGWIRRNELGPPSTGARQSSSVPLSPTAHCAKVLAAMGVELPPRPDVNASSSACDGFRQGWVATSECGTPVPKRARCEPSPSPIGTYAQREVRMAHVATLLTELPGGSNEQTKDVARSRLDIHCTKSHSMRAAPLVGAMQSKVATRDAVKHAAPPVGAVRSTAWTLDPSTSPIVPFAQRIQDTGQSPFGPHELLMASTPPSGLTSSPRDASSVHSGDSGVRRFGDSLSAHSLALQNAGECAEREHQTPDVDDAPHHTSKSTMEHAAAVVQEGCLKMESLHGPDVNFAQSDEPIPRLCRVIDLTQSPITPRDEEVRTTPHATRSSEIMRDAPHTPHSSSDMDMSESPAVPSAPEINSTGRSQKTVCGSRARVSHSPHGSDMDLLESPSSTLRAPHVSQPSAAPSSPVSRGAKNKRVSELPAAPRTLAHPARLLGFRFALPQRQKRKSSLSFIRRKSLATGAFRRVGGSVSAVLPCAVRRSSASMVWRPLTVQRPTEKRS